MERNTMKMNMRKMTLVRGKKEKRFFQSLKDQFLGVTRKSVELAEKIMALICVIAYHAKCHYLRSQNKPRKMGWQS